MTELDMSNLREIVNVYRAASAEILRWTKVKNDLNGTIKGVMGDAEIGKVDGVPALRKTVIRTTRFDLAAFKEEFPDLADQYTVETTQVRLTVIPASDAIPDQF